MIDAKYEKEGQERESQVVIRFSSLIIISYNFLGQQGLKVFRDSSLSYLFFLVSLPRVFSLPKSNKEKKIFESKRNDSRQINERHLKRKQGHESNKRTSRRSIAEMHAKQTTVSLSNFIE